MDRRIRYYITSKNYTRHNFYFQMSKIIFTTKYLSRQHLIMGLIASFCVILFLAFQFTNVETQSKQKANMAAAGNIVNSGDSIDWKTVDLKQRSIPSHIKGSLDSSIIKDNTFTIKVRYKMRSGLLNFMYT